VAAAAGCSNSNFMSNPASRSICSILCTSDTDCTAVGAGFKCTTGGEGGGGNLCTPPCAADSDCPTTLDSAPPPGQPWDHAACDLADHHCVF
jgi:hypothetical protein